jgi:hypothetical protein
MALGLNPGLFLSPRVPVGAIGVSHHPRGFLRVFSMSPKWLIQKKMAITPRKIMPNLAINQ